MSKDNRGEFLKTYFSKEEYTEKEVNGFWLIFHWNGQTEKWGVDVYTKESYSNYKKEQENYSQRNSLFKD